MKIYFSWRTAILTLFYVLMSCSPLEDNTLPEPPSQLGRGIFILNYGLENGEGASLDFYSTDSNRLHRNIFYERNGADVGKGLHDIAIWRQYALLTAEKSSVVWVINANTASIVGRYLRTDKPTGILILDAEKTYIGSAAQNAVHIMQTATLQPLGSINIARKVRQLVAGRGKVFAVPDDPKGTVNRIYVIDAALDKISDSLLLPGYPASVTLVGDSILYVLTAGAASGQSALVAIDTETLNPIRNIPLPPYDRRLAGFTNSDDLLFVLCGDVYKLDLTNSQASPELLIASSGRMITAILSDSKANLIYFCSQRNGGLDGYFYRYATDGILIDSLPIGIRPFAMAFNKIAAF